MNKIFTVLICVFAIGIGYSQGPAFKYQGVARNAQNASLNNQAIALRLTILNAGIRPYILKYIVLLLLRLDYLVSMYAREPIQQVLVQPLIGQQVVFN
ncbi:MAG: hypothetical protein IPI45_01375 [Saprospiraceae bacterium]|nr:hypothetical protein [Saprospiraceae bacterium]